MFLINLNYVQKVKLTNKKGQKWYLILLRGTKLTGER